MAFDFEPTEIPDVVVVRPRRHGDDRGFFMETWRASEFSEGGIPGPFVQDNVARSSRRVLRGLHYQLPPRPQGKLVRALAGSIFDVAVDLRRGAPSYGRWVGRRLDAEEGTMLWIPAGFAHGYQVLSDTADVFYKTTAEWEAEADRGVLWNDPEVGVVWPLEDPVLSDKDQRQPALADADNPFLA